MVQGHQLALAILPISMLFFYEKEMPNSLESVNGKVFDLDNTPTPVSDAIETIRNYFKERTVSVNSFDKDNIALKIESVRLSLRLHYDADFYQEVFTLEFLPDGRIKGNKEEISFLGNILLDEIAGTKSSPVMTENNAVYIPAYSHLSLPTKE